MYKELRDIKQEPDVPIYRSRMCIAKLKELIQHLGSVYNGELQGENLGKRERERERERESLLQ